MIVTCERCSTQFRLEDKRIPETGVRVRCSRCKYAFHIERPAASEEERVQRAAAKALEPRTPSPTQDLPEEEQDWQFNDDRAAPGGGASGDDGSDSPFGSTADGDLGAPEGYGFDAAAAGDASPLAAHEQEAHGDSGLELDSDRSAFGAGTRSGGGARSEEPAEEPGSGLDLAGAAPAPKPRKPPTPRPAPSRGAPRAPAAPVAGEEIGRPEEWDFFAEAEKKQRSTGSRLQIRVVQPHSPAPSALPHALEIEEEESAPPAWLGRIGGRLGWIALGALCLMGFYRGLTPNASGLPVAPASQRAGDVEIRNLRARWVDNLVAGELYVVSGEIAATGPAAAAVPGGLSLQFLDAQGEPLKRPAVPLGPELPDALLRQGDPEALHEMAQRAKVSGLRAGQRVAAVIPSVPADAHAVRFVTDAPFASPAPASSGRSTRPGAPGPGGERDGEAARPSADASPEIVPPQP